MKTRLLIGLCALLLLGGCGPHRISAAERAQQKREDAAQKQREQRAKQTDVAQAQRHEQAAAARKQRIKREKYLKEQVEKRQPLPRGVAQIGSERFLTDKAHADSLRHVCQDGPHVGYHQEGNDVADVSFLAHGQIVVLCKKPQFRWRDVNVERDLRAGKLRQPANGRLITPTSKVIVEQP